jgi:hypothetical protein
LESNLEVEAIEMLTGTASSVRVLALCAMVSAVSGCAVERHLILEVREMGSHAPVRDAHVEIEFVSCFRLGPPPPKVHLKTDADGRVDARILLVEPAFDITVSSDAVPPHGLGTADDLVLEGRYKSWSHKWRLINGRDPLLEFRLWFDTKSGSRPR